MDTKNNPEPPRKMRGERFDYTIVDEDPQGGGKMSREEVEKFLAMSIPLPNGVRFITIRLEPKNDE